MDTDNQGFGFNPSDKNHRIMLRQQLSTFGSPKTAQIFGSLLDYIDELEHKIAEYEGDYAHFEPPTVDNEVI